MALVKTKGVIIKVQDYKENDKLLWMYTEELGKVTCIAKGAKRSKSQLLSVTLPLCFGEYLLFKGKNLYNLQEGKIINSFQGLLNNLEKLTYSSYLCELIDICVESDETNATLFKEFMVCLYLLNTDVDDQSSLLNNNIFSLVDQLSNISSFHSAKILVVVVVMKLLLLLRIMTL